MEKMYSRKKAIGAGAIGGIIGNPKKIKLSSLNN